MRRTFLGVIAGVIFAYIGIGLVFQVTDGGSDFPCSAENLLFERPIDAVTGVGPDVPAIKDQEYGLDTNLTCDSWPSAFELWLTILGPICILLMISGALAGRIGQSNRPAMGSIAGAIAGGLPFLFVFAMRLIRIDIADIDWSAQAAVLGTTLTASALGYLGSYLATRKPNMKFDTDGQGRQST